MSFLRVTRAEAEFPADANPSPEEVFSKAKSNLEDFIRDSVLVRDEEPSIYIYRLAHEDHTQTGVVACCSRAVELESTWLAAEPVEIESSRTSLM